MKRFKVATITLLLCISSCKLSTIYTDSQKVKNAIDVSPIILKTTNAYGGQQNWGNVQAARAILNDDWPTFLWRLIANPWKEQTIKLNLDWLPNRNIARVKILSGKNKGKMFGIQNWATYSVEDSSIIFKKLESIKFHLPTMEYFLEFPFRIQEATKLNYGGTTDINEVSYKTILMSWNTFEPQKKIDQYLIYINPTTSLIDYLEFTVRDQGKFTYATVHFEDFKKVETFIFPHRITAYFQNRVPGKTIGHQMTIDTLILDKKFPTTYFVPCLSMVKEK
ncbi:MAG: hypothetical protein AAF039_10630 [Bacteroidota bacterium]